MVYAIDGKVTINGQFYPTPGNKTMIIITDFDNQIFLSFFDTL